MRALWRWDWCDTETLTDGIAAKLLRCGIASEALRRTSITHKRITEPNFIISELVSVIPVLWLPNRIFLELLSLGNHCELWTTEPMHLPYRNVLGIVLGNFGGGITEPNLFWTYFGNILVCNGIPLRLNYKMCRQSNLGYVVYSRPLNRPC